MGAFLSQMVGRLLGDGKPSDSEIDGNIVVCCGTLNVAEHEKDSDEKDSDDDQDALRG